MAHTLIIAEAGVNHNGDINLAKRLCLEAKNCGADIVKFQTFNAENLVSRTVSQADYQSKNIGKEESQFNMLKRLELSYDEFRELKKYCDEIGITFNSTAFDYESLDFLTELGISFIKISSGDITNIPYLRYVGSKHLPVVISSGMSYIADVDLALRSLRETGSGPITLLHCTTNYPCPYKDVNLKAMLTMKTAFDLPVGYSDHTKGMEIPVAAVALGAEVIEKHFTLDSAMNGPDHKASMEPAAFKSMVEAIRNVEVAVGSGIKEPSADEKNISKVVLKRIITAKEIKQGDILSEENVCVKRNSEGIPSQYWDLVIGTKATMDYSIDEPIVL